MLLLLPLIKGLILTIWLRIRICSKKLTIALYRNIIKGMKAPRGGSTLRQVAYAQRILGAKGNSRKEIALNVGYSMSAANSVKSHIESKPGFHNAMAKLAKESNNSALSAMQEFKSRGFKDFSNKDLVGALNAIGGAWSKFNERGSKAQLTQSTPNRLRTVILQQVENQTVNNLPAGTDQPQEIIDVEVGEAQDDPNDF